MIAEHSRTELNGKWLRGVVVDGHCFLTLPDAPEPALKRMGDGKEMTFKEAAKALDEISEELMVIKERFADLGGLSKAEGLIRRAQEPPSLIYDDVRALSSHDARHTAYQRFYANDGNRDLVLTITGCEPCTHNEGENVYRVSGHTRPRRKALRGTLRPARMTEAPGEEQGVTTNGN